MLAMGAKALGGDRDLLQESLLIARLNGTNLHRYHSDVAQEDSKVLSWGSDLSVARIHHEYWLYKGRRCDLCHGASQMSFCGAQAGRSFLALGLSKASRDIGRSGPHILRSFPWLKTHATRPGVGDPC